jgi:hypothetical protein
MYHELMTALVTQRVLDALREGSSNAALGRYPNDLNAILAVAANFGDSKTVNIKNVEINCANGEMRGIWFSLADLSAEGISYLLPLEWEPTVRKTIVEMIADLDNTEGG